MSATIERIDEYFRDLEYAVCGVEVDSKAAREAERAIKANYQDALNDVALYHRWFTQLRDGAYAELLKAAQQTVQARYGPTEDLDKTLYQLDVLIAQLERGWNRFGRDER